MFVLFNKSPLGPVFRGLRRAIVYTTNDRNEAERIVYTFREATCCKVETLDLEDIDGMLSACSIDPDACRDGYRWIVVVAWG